MVASTPERLGLLHAQVTRTHRRLHRPRNPVAELRIVAVRVEQGIRPLHLDELSVSGRTRQPPGVGLASKLEHPTRHRDKNPVCGQLAHERVESLTGRFACDRLAAARRRTSFSCISSRLRLGSSADSDDMPGLRLASTSAWRSQCCKQILEIPKSSAISLIITPGSRRWATGTTSSRNSLG